MDVEGEVEHEKKRKEKKTIHREKMGISKERLEKVDESEGEKERERRRERERGKI